MKSHLPYNNLMVDSGLVFLVGSHEKGGRISHKVFLSSDFMFGRRKPKSSVLASFNFSRLNPAFKLHYDSKWLSCPQLMVSNLQLPAAKSHQQLQWIRSKVGTSHSEQHVHFNFHFLNLCFTEVSLGCRRVGYDSDALHTKPQVPSRVWTHERVVLIQ